MLQRTVQAHIGSKGISRVRALKGRAFSSGPTRLAVQPPPTAPTPPKRHRVRNFFISSFLLLSGVSAGAIYYALKDDDFYYKLTGYVPFASPVIDTIDDFVFRQTVGNKPHQGAPSHLRKSVQSVPVDGTSKAFPESTSGEPKPIAPKPKASTTQAAPKENAKREIVSDKPKTGAASPNTDAPAVVAAKSAKPVEPSVVGKEAVMTSAKIPQTSVDTSDIDPMLSGVTTAINVCLRAHDVDLKDDVYFANLVSAVESASKELNSERSRLKAQYEAEVRNKTSSALEEADKEYLAAKLNLVESYNNRLQLALDMVTRKAIASANNTVAAHSAELWKEFGNKVSGYVEQERDGRLSEMAELKKDLETVQEAMLSSGRILESEDGVVSFFVELGNLQRVLSKPEVTPLKPYIDALTKALPSDPLVRAVADSVSPSVKKYGVLSHAQLAARFNLIEPKIRQASLAPPDAGIAGHLGSLAASQLLVRKEGLPDGQDVESILARTQTHLQQGDILRAVAEVNSLQGWPKKIASDWLDEGRKRSEVEFLVTVLSDEGRLWSISRN